MTSLRLAWVRLTDAWVRMFATSRAWVLAAYSIFLPLFWVGCLRVGPSLFDALAVYGDGRFALMAAAMAPVLWLGLFSQRIYQMPSRTGAWITHDFHFLLTQPLPLGRILLAMAAVWSFGDLPVILSACSLVGGFLAAIHASAALSVIGILFFLWMVLAAFLVLGLGRLAFHRLHGSMGRAGLALAALLLAAGLWTCAGPGPEIDVHELALAWVERPVPEAKPALLERAVPAAEPLLGAWWRFEPLAWLFPPYQLYRGLSMLAEGDPAGWKPLLGLAVLLALATIAPLGLAEPLSRRDLLALTHSVPEDPSEPQARATPPMERWPTGLDAKEVQLWAQFWTGPLLLAVASASMTWWMLRGDYSILGAAKLMGMATWMVGSLGGDSLGWERRGLVLCQLLPLTPLQILAAKARWAALVGVMALVVPFAAVGILMDAEPFTELVRGTFILTFLVFVAAHAGVAVGALLRDLSGNAEGQPGMGPLLGALMWLGLCAAMVAQVFFTSGYAIFGGLFFDLLLVVALWQRACVQLQFQHEPEEVRNEETVFADAVLVFLMAYLLVTFVVLRAQAEGASSATINALRTYLLTALFPLVLAALTWVHLRLLAAREAAPARGFASDVLIALPVAAVTVGLALAWSYGASRLGLFETRQLGAGVQMMRQMMQGLPAAPVLIFLLIAVIAPAAEEGFFRGLFYQGVRRLQPHDFRIAVLISSLAFALLHPAAHFPVIFTMGTLYAVLVERRGTLRAAMLAHMLHNAAMAIAFFTGAQP